MYPNLKQDMIWSNAGTEDIDLNEAMMPENVFRPIRTQL